ncbi:MAG: MotA/TolQ/ExbB proton channel family protein [Gammaproteobacteria bacterium]|nr:MotA/TolQ/ExbB proton channel family protein [Gammaproteobacteria bacterium]MBQ0838210.1 MotA/TolQ/ExbB proton channel family protein [Gammaproteobacteria bacterium]
MDLDLIEQGGPVVIVLIGLSIVGLALVFFKLFHYRHYSMAKIRSIEGAIDLWIGGDKQQALDGLDKIPGPYAAMLGQGIRWLDKGDKEQASIREELNRQGQQVVSQVNGMNGFVEQIAYLSPMLGLLGTVLGMIDVFRGLANQGGGGDTGALAGGIWEALMTTAVGLTVAIPFALIYYMLDSHATTIRRSMEDQLTRLFTVKLYGKS